MKNNTDKYWHLGAVVLPAAFFIYRCILDRFLHTDRLIWHFAVGILLYHIPLFKARGLQFKKKLAVIGVFLILWGISYGTMEYFDRIYHTDEILMPVYGRYMVENGKKDMVLIGTRAGHRFWSVPAGIPGPSDRRYVYIMENTGKEWTTLMDRLKQEHGEDLEIENNMVKSGDIILGACLLTRTETYTIVEFPFFEERPFK